jgi:hypothetical protein
MAKELLCYDPYSGISTYTDIVEGDKGSSQILVTQQQDVEPLLDYCAKLRNENVCTVKNEFFHYAMIPAVVQLQLRKKGINCYTTDEAELKRVNQEIEANYPKLKTSYAKHI